ncbi:MAG TPA: SDR family oxidoreductase, partial [Calditrichia bacterium]|nr:SDR family oxidoreductase [Calditrichia bacterium]
LAGRIEAGFGKLDILFVNAGIAKPAEVGAVDEQHYTDHFDINVKGAFFTIQKLLPILRDGGNIILNGTALLHHTLPGMSIYTASKAALVSLVNSLSAELSWRGIRVNAISPGPIETPIYGKMGMSEAEVNAMASGVLESVPLKRFGKPEEIANAALFLASEEAAYLAGKELVVDGGMAQV